MLTRNEDHIRIFKFDLALLNSKKMLSIITESFQINNTNTLYWYVSKFGQALQIFVLKNDYQYSMTLVLLHWIW